MARVMIVDDAKFMRLMLRTILEKGGHQVVGEAEDGEKAVEAYVKLHPDVVTMDITMPNMDGIKAIRAIKVLDPKARIVVCSAMGQQQLVIEAISAGAKDFVVKPFQEDRVLEAIKKVSSM